MSNGQVSQKRDYQNAPEEPLQLVDQSHYLPVATLVSRAAQICWNELSDLVDQLSNVSVPAQPAEPGRSSLAVQQVNNQTKTNLDKKDRILNFANDQKGSFIKLLVLLQWSRNVQEVTKTINLNFWLHSLRTAYHQACFEFYALKQSTINWQDPNPDIRTAGEVLALGAASSFSNLGYHDTKKLSKKQIISTLRRLNNLLTAKLALEESIPPFLRSYRVHDGRATFTVADEFEVDLSVLEEDASAQYRMVDLRFLFTPRPAIPPGLRAEIEALADSEIAQHGLSGCYEFLHNLVLSNKLAELHKQALTLARQQWAGHLRVEFLRRVLIVQYWTGRPMAKSWLEIGINSNRAESQNILHHPTSNLGIRWFREGRQVEGHDLTLDQRTLSFVNILRQVVAQHTSHTLDMIYDRLMLNPLFADEKLFVEESSSSQSPEDCYLRLGTTSSTAVTATINAVTGLTIISPASERANRLQLEVNRSKSLVDDFVPKYLNFRCATTEGSINSNISCTSWQSLFAFKPTLADIRLLLGPTVARANFFRHPSWSELYLLAVAYKPSGDDVCIVQLPSSASSLDARSRVIQSQALDFGETLSVQYFESLAEYASGVIVLDSLQQQFASAEKQYRMGRVPEHGVNSQLPYLSFDYSLRSREQPNGPAAPTATANGSMARFKFVGVAAGNSGAKVKVELESNAPARVLEHLAKSSPDGDIEFGGHKRQIAFHMVAPVGTLGMDDILLECRQRSDVIASIEFVETLKFATLLEVSSRTLKLKYQLDGFAEGTIDIQLPGKDSAPKIDFRPADKNPHACLGPSMSRLMQEDSRLPFVSHLENAMSSLTMLNPTLSTLRDLHAVSEQTPSDGRGIRMHLLIRQPTVLALQYYISETRKVDENASSSSNSRLLARFEILPREGEVSQLTLRPALEELKSYKRPSFGSNAIRDKVRKAIFNMADDPGDWLRLDFGAAFRTDQPKRILEALHEVMVECAEEVNGGSAEQVSAQAPRANNAQTQPTTKSNTAGGQKVPPKTPQQGQKGVPNGVPQQKGRSTNKSGQIPQGSEVITLD